MPAMETAQVSSDDENDDTEEIEEEQGQEDEGGTKTSVTTYKLICLSCFVVAAVS